MSQEAVPEFTIGILGGQRAGKTTYLASLRLASHLDPDLGWTIGGSDRTSIIKISEWTRQLRQGTFPEANSGATVPYSFNVSGTAWSDRLYGFWPVLVPFRVLLNGEDYRGGDLRNPTDINDTTLWDYLSGCRGLVYLFNAAEANDPKTNNYDTLDLATQFMSEHWRTRLPGGTNKLPHFIAICVAKCDTCAVVKPLKSAGLLHAAAEAPKIVTDPKKAFDLLSAPDPLTRGLLDNYFRNDRTEYFAISSTGYFKNREGKIDLDDAQNTDSSGHIRGVVSPVNVLEPLLWIYDKLRNLR